ncbi:MAG: hypothetical protein ACM3SU_08580 [Acidobacteriota bacterium]
MPPPRIGELLVARGLLSPAAVSRALGFQKSAAPRVKLGSILLTWDLIDEGNLLKALAALHHCQAVTGDMLARAPVDVVRMLPAGHAIRLNAIPYALEKSRIRVAFVNPSDVGSIDEVSALTGHVCVPGVVTELRLLQAHRRFYGRAIPLELRPLAPRAEPGRPSRPAFGEPGGSSRPATAIPVEARGAPAPRDLELPPITVPDLPIPPPPSTASREPAVPEAARAPGAPKPAPPAAAGAAPPTSGAREEATNLWIATPTIPPQSEAVLGMWSHPAPRVTEEEIGDLALGAVPPEFPRAILFSERGGALAAWRARGLPGGDLAGIRISASEPSVFVSVARSGAPHFGRVEPDQWPEPLARRIDGPPPCAVFPIQSGHGVAALLYADRRGAPMKFDDTALLARAAAEIAALLARLAPGQPS